AYLTSYFFRDERQLINRADPGSDSLITTAGSLPTEVHNVGRIAARGDDVRVTVPIQIAERQSIHRSLSITEAYLLEAAPTAIVEENRAGRVDISNDDVCFSIAVHVANRNGIRYELLLTQWQTIVETALAIVQVDEGAESLVPDDQIQPAIAI